MRSYYTLPHFWMMFSQEKSVGIFVWRSLRHDFYGTSLSLSQSPITRLPSPFRVSLSSLSRLSLSLSLSRKGDLSGVEHLSLAWCILAVLKKGLNFSRFSHSLIQAGLMTRTFARVLVCDCVEEIQFSRKLAVSSLSVTVKTTVFTLNKKNCPRTSFLTFLARGDSNVLA